MSLDPRGIKKIYASSTTNVQSFILPNLISQINQNEFNSKLFIRGSQNTALTYHRQIGLTLDENGVRMLRVPTGNYVDMEVGSNHENGQRYNVNHFYTNYMMIGYFKTSSSQEQINCKLDGPNHGSCNSLPKCVWLEAAVELRNGAAELQSEWPHPDNHSHNAPSAKTLNMDLRGKWIGWCCIAYQTGEFRTVEAWVDPDGLDVNGNPTNNWIQVLKETDTGQYTRNDLAKRELFLTGRGMECEIRMHGSGGGGHGSTTDMEFCRVYEILPITTPTQSNTGTGDDIDSWSFTNPDTQLPVRHVLWQFRTTGGSPLSSDCSVNHSFLESQGFTFSSNDWKNVELTGFFFIESYNVIDDNINFQIRAGHREETLSNCCSDIGYASTFNGSDDITKGGKVVHFKQLHSQKFHAANDLGSIPSLTNFYQKWVGFKLCVFNRIVNNILQVVVETYICPSDSVNDKANNWVLAKRTVDFAGANWGTGALTCNALIDDQPITWGNYFCNIHISGLHVRFKDVSIREIDPTISIGDGPDPPGPTEPTTILKTITLRREIINNAFCSCDGSEGDSGGGGNPPGGGSGGGGGSSSLTEYYFVSHQGISSHWKLASESSGNFKLRTGLVIKTVNSEVYNIIPKRIEVFIEEEDKPRGGTGGGVHVRVRKGTDNTIAVDFGTIDEDDLHDNGQIYTLDKLDNTYVLQLEDKILLEYDGGDSGDYVKHFRKADTQTVKHRGIYQDQDHDDDQYGESDEYLPTMRILGSPAP